MNNIKKYPVTYTLLALCIMTYTATTLCSCHTSILSLDHGQFHSFWPDAYCS